MAIKRITTNLIKDSDIATVDIANNAITAAKITDGNITTAKLADLSVTAGKLAGTLDLTGKTITVATATTGDNDTSPASTAFVQQEIAALVDSSPDSLNTLNELAAALGDDASFSTTVTNSIATKLPLAGGTLTGNLVLGDSVKAVFGAGSDLSIYHDGSNSYIREFGAGDLKIQAINVQIENSSGTKMFRGVSSGEAILYYNNSPKIATTSTGIDVTGTATIDGLTVASDTDVTVDIGRAKIGNVGFSDFAGFAHRDNASTGSYALLQYNTGETYLNAASGRDINIRINNSNVAIFKSSGNVGIGTEAPNYPLSLESTSTGLTHNLRLNKSSNGGDYAEIAFQLWDGSGSGLNTFGGSGTSRPSVVLRAINEASNSAAGAFVVGTFTGGGTNATLTEKLRLTSEGKLGIGTDSPTNYYSGADNLVIYQSSGEAGISVVTATNTTGALYFADGTSGDQQYRGGIAYQHSNDQLALVSGGATKATIDASGHLDLDGYIDNTRNNTSISPPSNSDHTIGTRIKFYDAGEAVWYAMGIENNHLWFNADPGFKFYSDSVLSATIDDDGIKFNGDTAAANALDDYEEGTFSPTLSNAYNITSLTLSEAGRYTKVGSLVHFEFQVTGSFTNAAVESRFSFTVPFNIATSSSRATGMFSHHLTSFSNGRFNNGQIFQGTSTNTASWVYISTNQLSGTGSFTGRGTFTYVAA